MKTAADIKKRMVGFRIAKKSKNLSGKKEELFLSEKSSSVINSFDYERPCGLFLRRRRDRLLTMVSAVYKMIKSKRNATENLNQKVRVTPKTFSSRIKDRDASTVSALTTSTRPMISSAKMRVTSPT